MLSRELPTNDHNKNMPEIVLSYFVELRKEILEAQKIRAQVIGFKVTFISTVTGILFANLDKKIDSAVFVMPALFAVFFDFLIYSYDFSIKRIGVYIRDHLEPYFKQLPGVPKNMVFWQQFLTQPKTRQSFSRYGNIGITILSVGIAIIALFFPFRPIISSVLLFVLAIFALIGIRLFLDYKKLGKIWVEKDFE